MIVIFKIFEFVSNVIDRQVFNFTTVAWSDSQLPAFNFLITNKYDKVVAFPNGLFCSEADCFVSIIQVNVKFTLTQLSCMFKILRLVTQNLYNLSGIIFMSIVNWNNNSLSWR